MSEERIVYMYDDKCYNDYIPKDKVPLADMPIAMAYVPWQDSGLKTWGKLYELDTAFEVGTIFKELNKPFLGY
jgi:hypothetical protein